MYWLLPVVDAVFTVGTRKKMKKNRLLVTGTLRLNKFGFLCHYLELKVF
jgi:hypothetical protein